MRRKSERNKGKSPEPAAKPEKPKRGRPSRKRRKSSSSPERESGSDEASQENLEVPIQTAETSHPDRRKSGEGNCDDDSEPVWQVKKSESSGDSSEIQKLKICLARPPSTPERADRSPRGKKRSSHSSVDTLSDTGEEKRKSRHKRRNSSKEATTGDDASEAEEPVNKINPPTEEKQSVVDSDTSQQSEIPAPDVSEEKEDTTTKEDTAAKQTESNVVEIVSTVNEDEQKEELPVTTETVVCVDESPSVQDDTKVETTAAITTDEPVKDASPSDSDKRSEEVTGDKGQIQEDQSDVQTEEKPTESNEDKAVDSKDVTPDDNVPVSEEIPPDNSVEDTSEKDNKKEDVVSTTPDKQSKIDEDTHCDSTKNSGISEEPVRVVVRSESVTETGSVRKRRWGSRTSKVTKPSTVRISTDSLKNLIPNVEPVSVEDVLLEVKPKEETRIEKVIVEEKVKPNGKYNNIHDKPKEREILGSVTHRKISVVNDDIPKEQRSPSPPKHKSSAVLYISNLVRPFTLPQLKNLLLRTGKIVENGFWIDKIKSRCYVQYQSEDEAIETRHALHGVTWPVSNPKTLVVDFSSESAMRDAMDSNDDDKVIISAESRGKESNAKENDFRRDNEIYEKRMVIREWDVGKGDNINRDMRDDNINRMPGHGVGGRYMRDQPDGDRNDKRKRRTKSPSPARKFKKKEDEAPSKLLDDLFRKTKATPCIYWLPLNAETISIKEEQRRKHMEEHEKRMEELRRANEERTSRHTYHASNRHR